MTIEVKMSANEKVIELGGGAFPRFHPNVDIRQAYDPEGNPTVDIPGVSFEEPLPITSEEWDAVWCQFAAEHITYQKIPQFLKEVFRILKPGGKAVLIVPNTEAQMKWILANPNGWDGKSYFLSASENLFGSQDYADNTHKSFWSPSIAQELFKEAGFQEITTTPYGTRETDMVIQARRPIYKTEVPTKQEEGRISPLTEEEKDRVAGAWNSLYGMRQPLSEVETMIRVAEEKHSKTIQEISTPAPNAFAESFIPNVLGSRVAPTTPIGRTDPEPFSEQESKTRAKQFDSDYFNGGKRIGGYVKEGYKDFDSNENVAANVLRIRPTCVLEIGSGRGYVLKRLQDSGLPSFGVDISKYAYMTRVADGLVLDDICNPEWHGSIVPNKHWDLCFSLNLLEHIPEQHLPTVCKKIAEVSKRGLHGVSFDEPENDQTVVTVRPKDWWISKFAEYTPGYSVQIVKADELKIGVLPNDLFTGDGKVKIQLGSAWTMFRRGWQNLDIMDLHQFAGMHGYAFIQHDLRGILPYATGTVDLIFAHHVLHQLNYRDGLALLRECRRILKPNNLSGMRIIVPDGELLSKLYFYDNLKNQNLFVGELHGEMEHKGLSYFDEISEECKEAKTPAMKLHSLLYSGGAQTVYDQETLDKILQDSGFNSFPTEFRKTEQEPCKQVLRECTEMWFGHSFCTDCIPMLG